MSTLHFRVYSSPNCRNLSLQDIDLTNDVNSLRKKLSDLNQDVKTLNLIFLGRILKDGDKLQDMGLCQDSLIYCTPKYDANAPAAAPLSFMESQQLMSSLRSAVSSPNFRALIKKFCSIEQTERLISECPSLRRDPAALAFIQDPDLLFSLLSANLDRHLDDRPALGRLLQIVCTLITSEVNSPRRSHHVSYSMDALSDEEMEIEHNEGVSASNSRPGGSSSFPITPAQLAAALANATGGGVWRGAASSSSAPRSGLTTPSASSTPFNTPAPNSGSRAGGASPGGPTITTDMFSQALQNALAASASRGSGPLTSQASNATGSNFTPPLENLEESLQLMREMGIADEELGAQALQATNGDVQAAVNLIFAQWMADD